MIPYCSLSVLFLTGETLVNKLTSLDKKKCYNSKEGRTI